MLAWAQSTWVARQIEKHNPGTRVELVGIETRGDKIQDVSLQVASQMTGGKEFFVAEIDEALRSGAVDLTVHSMKDLSLDRPAELMNAAIPKRENPRDVALFSPGILKKLREGGTIRVGTSSPRRLENIPAFLEKALPRFGQAPRLEFVEIRGNVNTRLSRVREPEGAPKQLDAVILAFAGLIRLWNDDKGREELRALLKDVRWMVLPLRENPAAPAQGALAIECRRGDQAAFQKIHKIHCDDTEAHVAIERALLAEWGGGCHQKFGATAVSTSTLSKLFFIRGKKPDGVFVDELRWQRPKLPQGAVAWDGSEHRATTKESSTQVVENLSAPAWFVAHWRALPAARASDVAASRVWVSGTSSWYKLAEQGVWVEGSAENLGFEVLQSTLMEPVLGLPALKDWSVLTHEGAADAWKEFECHAVATYRVPVGYSAAAVRGLTQATHVFWSSASQFDELKDSVPPNAHQACGPGKTAKHLAALGIQASVFPSAEEWKKWISGA